MEIVKIEASSIGQLMTPVTKEPSGTYFTSYSNLLETLSIIPFKLEWDANHSKFVTRSRRIRQIVSGIIGLCSLLMLLSWLVRWHFREYVGKHSKSPTESLLAIFTLIRTLVSILKGISFYDMIWRKREMMLRVANNLESSFPNSSSHYKLSMAFFYSLLILSNAINLATLVEYFPTLENVSHKCMEHSCSRGQSLMAKFPWAIIFAGVQTVTSTMANFLFYSFLLSMRWAGICYEEECFPKGRSRSTSMSNSNEGKKFEKRIAMYYAIKALTTEGNELMGNFIFALYLELLLYSASCMGLYSDVNEDKFQLTMLVFNSGLTLAFWALACEFHQKVNGTACEWIQLYNSNGNVGISQDDRMRLMTLTGELGISPIGISCKFFSITYGFIGSMLGLIITYGIIVLQMSPGQSQAT